jgi:hypothetical protein
MQWKRSLLSWHTTPTSSSPHQVSQRLSLARKRAVLERIGEGGGGQRHGLLSCQTTPTALLQHQVRLGVFWGGGVRPPSEAQLGAFAQPVLTVSDWFQWLVP